MSNWHIAKNLIKDGKYNEAIIYLEKYPRLSPKLVEILSHLYQIENLYEKEEELIKKALRVLPANAYVNARRKWYMHPLFDPNPSLSRTTPRPPLHLDRESTPKPETMEKLCIVSGCDSNYFSLMWEMIESLKATRFYKDIPINIIDCGLKDSHKHILSQQINGGTIKDPGWITPFDKIFKVDTTSQPHKLFTMAPDNRFKGVANKPFLDTIFPGYKYYLWINPNFWVQDERALDQYVCMCEKQDFSVSCASHFNSTVPITHSIFNAKYLSENEIHVINQMPFIICDAACCIRAESPFYKSWKTYFQNSMIKNEGFYYYQGESTATLSMHEHGINELVPLKYFNYFPDPKIYSKAPYHLYNNEIPESPLGLIRPKNFENYSHEVLFEHSGETRKKTASTRFRIIDSTPALNALRTKIND